MRDAMVLTGSFILGLLLMVESTLIHSVTLKSINLALLTSFHDLDDTTLACRIRHCELVCVHQELKPLVGTTLKLYQDCVLTIR